MIFEQYVGMDSDEFLSLAKEYGTGKLYDSNGLKENVIKVQEADIDLEIYLKFAEELSSDEMKSDKDKNGKVITSKRDKVLDLINDFELSNSQKDTLYYMAGYSEKTIDDTPWH